MFQVRVRKTIVVEYEVPSGAYVTDDGTPMTEAEIIEWEKSDAGTDVAVLLENVSGTETEVSFT